jgi:hypothetical protein
MAVASVSSSGAAAFSPSDQRRLTFEIDQFRERGSTTNVPINSMGE